MNNQPSNPSLDLNWIGQILEALQANPELVSVLQGLATQFTANEPVSPGRRRRAMHSVIDGDFADGDFDDGEFDETPGDVDDCANAADYPTGTDEALTLFGDAFGFCPACLVGEAICPTCAAGDAVQGPDDDTFLALVVPVLGQLAPETRLELAEHLQTAIQDSPTGPGRSRPVTTERHARN